MYCPCKKSKSLLISPHRSNLIAFLLLSAISVQSILLLFPTPSGQMNITFSFQILSQSSSFTFFLMVCDMHSVIKEPNEMLYLHSVTLTSIARRLNIWYTNISFNLYFLLIWSHTTNVLRHILLVPKEENNFTVRPIYCITYFSTVIFIASHNFEHLVMARPRRS